MIPAAAHAGYARTKSKTTHDAKSDRRAGLRSHIKALWHNAALLLDDGDKLYEPMMMAHIAQLMPVTIPELAATNYRMWKTSVEAYAALRSISNFLEADVPAPSANADAHLAKKGEVKLLLLTTISQGIQLKLGDDLLDRDPNIIYNAIKETFTANNTPAEHDRLRRKSDGLIIRKGESLVD